MVFTCSAGNSRGWREDRDEGRGPKFLGEIQIINKITLRSVLRLPRDPKGEKFILATPRMPFCKSLLKNVIKL